ncbi:MAG: response regulator [Blastocatellia bacterium]|nr:response regulator [Blastocatellia bacterium]
MTLGYIELLLAEDSPTDRELTLLALRSNKLANQIHVVEDGAEALDFLFARGAYANRQLDHPPKVILLDLKLPKIDGIEVLRQVRAHPQTAHIPVVILTSSAEERDVVESYHLGVNSYIVKPVDFEQFSQVVRQLGLYWLLLNQSPLP